MIKQPRTITVDLLRHGKPEGGKCLLGSTDHSLTEQGWQELRSTASIYSGWNRIVSSPLQRCSAFAENFSKQRGLPLTKLSGWREIDFGLWDGKSYEYLHQAESEALSAFWSDPLNNTPPEGEPVRKFAQRIQSSWQDLINQSSDREHILLVTHSGVIRQLIAYILDIPETSTASTTRLNLPYASLCRIEVYVDEQGEHWPRLMFLDTTSNSSTGTSLWQQKPSQL
ncbi:histidine phosphatase family protein [Parendozoicomonas sp. Alg238-R29]|uniref:histidine phosphatase family protein n=1 Tax=Parendozoicomonas sp. Alg238-R29 TaxID=2993446 RepID=UPI00248EBDD1|nr:histidine phosphatase family protein [Parendozoicomonas sp. Alg238-R29]